MSNDPIRAFVAIPLAETVIAELGSVQRGLQKRVAPETVRWVRPNQIHLTLSFLGQVQTDQVAALESALHPIATDSVPFPLHLEKPGCFPDFKRPRIVWVGLGGNLELLLGLQRRIQQASAGLGEHQEERPFQPHLTIGRIKNAPPKEAQRLGDRVQETVLAPATEWTVRQFDLMRSDLSPQGPTYHIVASFPLIGAPNR